LPRPPLDEERASQHRPDRRRYGEVKHGDISAALSTTGWSLIFVFRIRFRLLRRFSAGCQKSGQGFQSIIKFKRGDIESEAEQKIQIQELAERDRPRPQDIFKVA
jgi:hypothetical protein